MKLNKAVVALVTALTLTTGGANAAYSLSGLVAGPVANPGSFTATVDASAPDSAATLDFVLNGFNSLDGRNSYQDLLTLTINDVQSFIGSFNLGGGGTSDTMFGSGTALTVNEYGSSPGTGIGWHGGTTTVTGLSFNLLAGLNTFMFAYSAPGQSNGLAGQSLSDEGWGVSAATVSAVPEPESYPLMLAGLMLIGTIVRRRKVRLS